jgi:hypothetical protein
MPEFAIKIISILADSFVLFSQVLTARSKDHYLGYKQLRLSES